jgi:hypothetical protein
MAATAIARGEVPKGGAGRKERGSARFHVPGPARVMTMIGYSVGPPLAGVSSDLFEALDAAEALRWALVGTTSFFAIGGLVLLRASTAIKATEPALTP